MMTDSVYVHIQETQKDLSRQFFIIKFKDIQPADYQYKIHIKYTGRLQDNMEGFYKSSYTIANKTRLDICFQTGFLRVCFHLRRPSFCRWIAATQFQPTDARKAFPCFDEPALKAKFTLSIARPGDMSSISNTGLKSVNNSPKL